MLFKPVELSFISARRWSGEKNFQRDYKFICGVPYERTESFRGGASLAPSEIREFSHSLESYSIILGKDLEEIKLFDIGDLDVSELEPEDMIWEVEEAISSLLPAFPLVLGGEHTISLGVIRALANHYPELYVISLDAHPDFRSFYEGRKLSHATVLKRISEVVGKKNIFLLGIRTSTPEEWEELKGLNKVSPEPIDLPLSLRDKPIYLSLDIDVLDPSCAPGTGNPEPGGWSFKELQDFLLSLRGFKVVGMDIVEVSPPLDPSGITIVAAAKIAREALLLF
ncbi:agmatinase [bacterium]|nr:agmatinase [bacterium]